MAETWPRSIQTTASGDLLIKQPSRYFLTVNASAARDIGLTLPEALLAQADSVLN